MKKQKDNLKQQGLQNVINKRAGRSIKEVVPSFITKHLRENTPIPKVDASASSRSYLPYAEPFDIPPEWNEEEVRAFNKEVLQILVDSDEIQSPTNTPLNIPHFEDPDHNILADNLPLSFLKSNSCEIKWLKIEDVIKNYLIDKEIKKSYPKKHHIKMRNDIKETYQAMKKSEEESNLKEKMAANNEYVYSNEKINDEVDTLLADDEESRKKNLYKEFYKILEMKLDLKVVSYKEREESDEEYKQRKEEELQEKAKQEAILKAMKKQPAKANDKKANNKNNIIIEQVVEERLKIKEIVPSNISLIEVIKTAKTNFNSFTPFPANSMTNSYCKWITSVLQVIKDLEIPDCYSGKSIWNNIFPQKDDIPVPNPQGKYIVKLYFMGKPRMIIIDDKIPSNKNEEFIFPKAEHIDELWPAIFTKALLKLHSYKIRHPQYYLKEEFYDTSIFYSLTGYLGQLIDTDDFRFNEEENLNNFLNMLEQILSDEVFQEKKKLLICLHRKDNTNALDPDKEIYESFLNVKSNVSSPFIKKIEKKVLEEFSLPKMQNLMKRNSLFVKVDKALLKSMKEMFNERMQSDKREAIIMTDEEDEPEDKKSNTGNIPIIPKHFRRTSTVNGEQAVKNTSNKDCGSMCKNTPERKPKVTDSTKTTDSIKTNNNNPMDDLTLPNSNIFFDFAYSICDFFDNCNFNMNRLKALDFSDLKQKIKDAQVAYNYKQLNLDQKKLYISNLIELKNKQKEEKVLRMEELKKEGKKFNLVKLKNECHGIPVMNFLIPYSEDEIMMARRCLVNQWTFPPPTFFDNMFKDKLKDNNVNINDSNNACNTINVNNNNNNNNQNNFLNTPAKIIRAESNYDYSALQFNDENTSIMSKEKKKVLSPHERQANNYPWNRDAFMQLIEYNTDQYLITQDPIVRERGGVWINFPDFKKFFNRFIILYNPCKVYTGGLVTCDSNWTYWKSDAFEPLFFEDFNAFYFSVKQNVNNLENQLNPQPDSSDVDSLTSIMVIFELNGEKSFASNNKIFCYISLELVDIEGNIIQDNIILSSFFSTYNYSYLESSKEYFLVIKGGVVPFGYHLQVFAENHSVENISHSNYLKKFKNFFSVIPKFEHPPIENNKLYLFSRLMFKCSSNSQHCTVKLSFKYSDKYAKKFIEIFCYQNKNGNKKKINFNEMINLECYDSKDNSNPNHNANTNTYFFTFSIKCPYNLPEGSFEIECLYSDKEAKIDFIDHIEPYELTDKIGAHKQGIIFKEFIYSPDIVYASLEISLKKSEDIEIKEKIRMYLELYKVNALQPGEIPLNKDLLSKLELCNGITLHHLTLEGVPVMEKPINDKKGNKDKDPGLLNQIHTNLPYLLVLYVDMSEMPDYLKDIIHGKSLGKTEVFWTIRIFSSDTLGFVKDTTKEDYERNLKDSWEVSEPGRAEKAKKARLKYLAQCKKDRCEKLTPEEERILTEERERKLAQIVEENKNANAGNINASKKTTNAPIINKEQKKNANDIKNADKKITNKSNRPISNTNTSNTSNKNLVIITPKKLPQPTSHTSDYIRSFLFYSYQERTIVFNNNLDQFKKLIIDESVKENKTAVILKKTEEFESRRAELIESESSNKADLTETYKTFYRTASSFRKEVKDDTESLIKARDMIKNDLQMKIDLEKNISEFLKLANNGSVIDANQLTQASSLYLEAKEIQNNNPSSPSSSPMNRHNQFGSMIKKLFNTISNKKEEFLRNELKKLTAKDKQHVLKYLEDIETCKWNISEEIVRRLQELVK